MRAHAREGVFLFPRQPPRVHGSRDRTGASRGEAWHPCTPLDRQPPNPLTLDASTCHPMHEVFGDVVLHRLDGGQIEIQAKALQVPPLLLPPASGAPLPEIPDAFLDVPVCFIGLLPTAAAFTTDGNIAKPCIHFQDAWFDSSIKLDSPSFLYASAIGNLGGKAETNPAGDRLSASLAINDASGATAWLSLQGYSHISASAQLAQLEKGDRVSVYGHLETFRYKNTDRTRLSVRGLQRVTSGGGKPQVTSLSATRPAMAAEPVDSVF